jgi:hypothetical protein
MTIMRDPAKEPVIRPGQKKGYTKATRQQIEHRIESAALLRFCGFEKSEIHRVFRAFYGVEWRQTDRYIYMALARVREARERLPRNPAKRYAILRNSLI